MTWDFIKRIMAEKHTDRVSALAEEIKRRAIRGEKLTPEEVRLLNQHHQQLIDAAYDRARAKVIEQTKIELANSASERVLMKSWAAQKTWEALSSFFVRQHHQEHSDSIITTGETISITEREVTASPTPAPQQQATEAEQPIWAVERDEITLTEETVGKGGWGVVKVAHFRGTRVAAKCLYSMIASDYNRRLFIREMNIAAKVRHPNLLQFIAATIRGELIILTELMPTSLRAVLERGPISHQQTISISLDVARALNYLHLMRSHPIIHRDLSSGNVLLEPGPNNSWKAKVSDYGSANFLQQLRTAGPGNPNYTAPEAFNPYQQSPKMDIFSFGILLVEMCTDSFPDTDSHEELIQSIADPRMVGLIRECTAKERDRRPSAAEIMARLSEL